MKFLYNKCLDPRYNLALEEYLFLNAKDDIFILWRNDKSVIIGKNQNVFTEVDLDFTRNNNISVVRRITGGGAVFHDVGNVNYTFITPNTSSEKGFKYFCLPIINALSSLGIHAEFSGRNDLAVDGRKISGSARCEKNGKIMHHGTLLFSADMSRLSSALTVNAEKIKSKGIKSVKSRVVNINELLSRNLTVLEFIELIERHIKGEYNCEPLILSSYDIEKINKLKETKYDTDKWNMSVNLPFEKTATAYFPFGLLTVSYTVKNGILSSIKFHGDFFGKEDISELEEKLCGSEYTSCGLFNALTLVNIKDYIANAENNDIINLILK